MQTTNSVVARTQGSNTNAEPLKLTKRIGSTTYIINVYNGVPSHDKLEYKVLRLIKGDAERTTMPSAHIATPTPKSARQGVKDSA